MFCRFFFKNNLMEGINKILAQSIEVVKEVGDFIWAQAGKQLEVETKSLNSFVTYVDKEAEKMLVQKLGALIPNATFITEEKTVEQLESELQWIIDPLDGTTNFIQQIPHYSTSVALKYKGEIVLGIVNHIPQKECFYASKNEGAFLNGKPIQVSGVENLDQAIIATGFPYERSEIQNRLIQVFNDVLSKAKGIRRLGSAALDLSYVACGRMDAYYEGELNPWDVAAGILIVVEAGGKLSDYRGEDNYFSGKEIIASNPFLEKKLIELVKKK